MRNCHDSFTGSSIVDSSGANSEQTNSPIPPLKVDKAALLKEMKYNINFKKKMNMNFKLETLQGAGRSINVKITYNCFNATKGISINH